MSSSKLLKERIESIQDTMKITNAMYLISSSKLRKARQNYQNVSPYFNRMRDTISRVVPHLPEEPEHPFFHERNLENPRRAYLVLTADKGMAGAYNQNLLKFLREHADPNDRFYVIGQVGYRALRHRDPRLVEEFRYSATAPTLQRARDITVDAIDDFKSGKLDEIYIVYTKIQNALTSACHGASAAAGPAVFAACSQGSGRPQGRGGTGAGRMDGVRADRTHLYARHDLWCHDRELLRRAERPHDRHGFCDQERQ